MTIGFNPNGNVVSVSNLAVTTTTTLTIRNVRPRNTLFLLASFCDSAATGAIAPAASWVQDGLVGPATLDIGVTAGGTSGTFVGAGLWRFSNVAAGTHTVLLTPTGGTGPYYVEATLFETTPVVLDHAPAGVLVTTSPANCNATGAQSSAADLALAMGGTNGGGDAVPAIPAGFTSIYGDNGGGTNVGFLGVYQLLGSNASIAPAFTAAGPPNSFAALVATYFENVPTINADPVGASILEWQTAILSVTASASSGGLNYQWQDNRSGSFASTGDGSGATSAAYTTPPLPVSASGRQYQCVVTDSNGSATSLPGIVMVLPYPQGEDPLRYRKRQGGGMSWGLKTTEWW